MVDYNQQQNTAATGGQQPPAEVVVPPGLRPDDIPSLETPTQFPDEPITAGLPIGAGPGPSTDTRMEETIQLRRYLPLLELYLDQPDTPNSVRSLFRYIRGT
jgi:hypothetical protein